MSYCVLFGCIMCYILIFMICDITFTIVFYLLLLLLYIVLFFPSSVWKINAFVVYFVCVNLYQIPFIFWNLYYIIEFCCIYSYILCVWGREGRGSYIIFVSYCVVFACKLCHMVVEYIECCTMLCVFDCTLRCLKAIVEYNIV